MGLVVDESPHILSRAAAYAVSQLVGQILKVHAQKAQSEERDEARRLGWSRWLVRGAGASIYRGDSMLPPLPATPTASRSVRLVIDNTRAAPVAGGRRHRATGALTGSPSSQVTYPEAHDVFLVGEFFHFDGAQRGSVRLPQLNTVGA